MQMPVIGGLEAVEWLRQTGDNTPITMLTANAMKTERDKCLSLGANDFLTKPIDRVQFYKVLSQYLPSAPSASPPDSATSVDAAFDDEFADLRNNFLEELPARMNKLSGYTTQRDWVLLKAEIHRLKGIGGGLGFPEITSLCKYVEEQLAHDNEEAALNLLSELLRYCEQITQDDGAKGMTEQQHETGTNTG
jgi:HPt (histidine-containing phosphotransfer) domain-containing protein